MNRRDKLKRYYERIDELNDEIPREVTEKMLLHGQALLIIGKFHAEAVNEYGKAYADRKATWGEIAIRTEGTGVIKEAAADQGTRELRMREAKTESEMNKWKYLYTSTIEIINGLKVHLKVLMKEYGD